MLSHQAYKVAEPLWNRPATTAAVRGRAVKQLDLAIVLAAGEGTRMKSELPKVLHPIAGRPILDHVLLATAPLNPAELRIVVGASREKVGAHISANFPSATQVVQAERNGTGHAVQLALESAPHLGSGTNIGAATIFVNYDGVEKHQTTIGNDVRIGSDTMLVAPLTVGDGAYTAAGSVITEDVPAGSIGVARAKQRNVLGWVLRKRAGSNSAESARKAGATEGSTKVQGEA